MYYYLPQLATALASCTDICFVIQVGATPEPHSHPVVRSGGSTLRCAHTAADVGAAAVADSGGRRGTCAKGRAPPRRGHRGREARRRDEAAQRASAASIERTAAGGRRGPQRRR